MDSECRPSSPPPSVDTSSSFECLYCALRPPPGVAVVHSWSELDRFICLSLPCIVCSVVPCWPAFKQWSASSLVERVGDAEVPVRTHFTRPQSQAEWLGDEQKLPFTAFMEHWKEQRVWSAAEDAGGTAFYYLASLPMNKHFPQLCADIVVPPYPLEQKKSGNLWIGNAGQITPVHYDYSTGDPGMDGLHAVISGRKIFRLFSPAGNEPFFPRKRQWGRFHQAVVDLPTGLPDPNVYPQFKQAQEIMIELVAGDMLFIPKLWWHHVLTLEPSIAVNFWFQHFGSEELKLAKHWGHMEEYLKAVEEMEIKPEKMKNVLKFFGLKGTEEEVQLYMSDHHKFMLLPQFIKSFANGLQAPWMDSPRARLLGKQIQEKVTEWIVQRIQEKASSTVTQVT